MTEYVTVTEVEGLLGDAWAPDTEKLRYVAMANAYLSAMHIQLPSPTPENIKMAGSELAAAAADNQLYAQASGGAVTKKRVKAGSAEVETSYSESASIGTTTLPERVQFALALVAQYKAPAMSMTVGYGDCHGIT